VVATHHVTDPLDCIFLCVSNTQCLSINYKPSGSGDKDVCELNNATRISDSGSYKNDSRSDHYYDMEIEVDIIMKYILTYYGLLFYLTVSMYEVEISMS
jgi:hypothetical protein